jgi:hypothetical protein
MLLTITNGRFGRRNGHFGFEIELPDWVEQKARCYVKAQTHGARLEYRHLQAAMKESPRWWQVLEEAVQDGLTTWISVNDPPNEDGESEMEYYAYGYEAGDLPDYYRLLISATRWAAE